MIGDPQTIPDDMAARVARLINEAEDMRQQAADDLKQIYADLREELRGLGWDGKHVSAEVAALKGAIGEMRLDEKAKEKREEKGERIDDYVSLLTRARAREGNGYAAARRSDGGLSILTKHEDIRTAPVTAEEASEGASPASTPSLTTREAEESVVSNNSRPAALAVSGGEPSIPSPDAGGEKMDADQRTPGRSDETSAYCNAQSGQATNSHSEKATVATQGEATAPTSDERETDREAAAERDRAAANAGGDDVDGGAERADQNNTVLSTGEGTANTALPAAGVVMEYVPQSGVKRLPFASCFPELSKAEYDRLEKDIAVNRVREPIIRQGDVIIDGWNRYTIARKYGFSYPVQEYTGADVLLDLIEWQRAARNFTTAQEKKIAADLAKAMPDRADDIMTAFGLAEALEAAE
ncbi:hypothetical protein GB928_018415 [Shinella curvata]|uniref:ParB/Sulfiredoxin domain-containing protein n=1 Tax=Shinella curvata TaxID=1817964 RepID=A0ABT8XHK8_9HYPH|nr:hypothetical protein [Shinella curvata]MCJ8053834.1 hypothetical protein [Shinella curvata]MDO6123166.1 hypothetical protein [Shinella curvata]